MRRTLMAVGGGAATLGTCGFLWSRQKNELTEDEQCRALGLPTPAEAQRFPVLGELCYGFNDDGKHSQ